jgi:ribonuclease J
VLVTHPHTDHCYSIRWLRNDIPTYCTPTARTVILAREYSGKLGPSSEYYIANWTQKAGKQTLREFKDVPIRKEVNVAGFPVTGYEVDHSVPGSVGYIIETKTGVVVYTGDFRMHGPDAQKSRDFLKAASKSEPKALLIEGTRVDGCRIESEEEVRQKLECIVNSTKGLVMAGFVTADIERLKTFHSVAKSTDRLLVLTEKQAFMVHNLLEAGQVNGIDLGSRNIMIFEKDKKSTYEWEKCLFVKYPKKIIDALEVKGMQEKAILAASLTDMLAMPVIDPMPGSIYVLSSSEPFNEEMEISYDKLIAWLSKYGLPVFKVHSSGHATIHDLVEAISTVKPKKVYLVHTENPMLYSRFIEKLGFDVVQPEEGHQYQL